MAVQTVFREGDRIRSSDGFGYGDSVSDEAIREHLGDHNHRLHFRLVAFVEFAEAVLAIRAYERAVADHA